MKISARRTSRSSSSQYITVEEVKEDDGEGVLTTPRSSAFDRFGTSTSATYFSVFDRLGEHEQAPVLPVGLTITSWKIMNTLRKDLDLRYKNPLYFVPLVLLVGLRIIDLESKQKLHKDLEVCQEKY